MAINSCIPAVTLRKLKLNLHIAMVKSLNKNYLDVVEKHTDSGVLLLLILKKMYGPFLWMGFNCLKAAEPLLPHG